MSMSKDRDELYDGKGLLVNYSIAAFAYNKVTSNATWVINGNYIQ